MNRCLNDLFAYCNTTPDAQANEVDVPFTDIGGKPYIEKCWITTCGHNPKDCEHRITNTELPPQIDQADSH